MIIKGLNNIRDFLHSEHMKNREEYYKRNPPGRAWRYRGGNISDFDAELGETGYQYPGAAADCFDIPNR